MIICTPEWQDILGNWLVQRTGGTYIKGNMQCIGLLEDGKIIAAAGFDSYLGNSICGHVAIDGRMNREFVRVCFDYVFNQLKVYKFIGLVDSTNEKALRFDKNLGFEEEHRIKGAARNGDLVILSMTKESCRMLKKIQKT